MAKVDYITLQLKFINLNDISRNKAILTIYDALYNTYDVDNLFTDESGKNKGVKFTYTSIDNDIIQKMREQELDFLTVELYRELRYRMTTSSNCFSVKKTKTLLQEIALAFGMINELSKIEDAYKDLYLLNHIVEIKNSKDETFITCVNATTNFEKYFHKVIKDRETKEKKRAEEKAQKEAEEKAQEELKNLKPEGFVEADPFALLSFDPLNH